MAKKIPSSIPLRFPCALCLAFVLGGCASVGGDGSYRLNQAPGVEPFPPATPRAVVDVTKIIFPAVVRLDVTQERFKEGKRVPERSIGSGVIIDDRGRILTNFHVAGRASEIYVTLYNKERVPAKVIGDDHWTDLAVVQMDMKTVHDKNITFNAVKFGDSKTLLPGQDVMAVGTPFGLNRTLTLGVVSNTDRTFYPERMTIDDEYETGDFSNWIQMDTPINPGNSGGPLVDLTGKIVGINTRGGGQNLNFAIPANTAKEVLRKILDDAAANPGQKAHVARSDLGIDLKPLNELERFYDVDVNRGVLINSVDRNSPADKAGVRTQDILLNLNGQPVNVRFPEEVAAARKRIADLPVGSDVALTIKRGKETLYLTAKTQKLEGAVGEEQALPVWGMSVRDVTVPYANLRQLDDDQGVVITTTTPGYPAAKGEVSEGDIIRSIDNQPATDIDVFMKLYDASVKSKEPTVLLEVTRGGRDRQVRVMKVTYDEK